MIPNKNYFKKYAKENNLPWQEKNILREYLQTQVLKALSLSDYGNKVSFLGGTCLRFVYKIDRFSEDLDFDLLVKDKEFNLQNLADELGNKLELLGLKVDSKVKTTKNIHIVYFKFRNVLQEFGFNVHKDEKLMIKFEIDYTPYSSIKTETKFVDGFNERFPIIVNELETLFAQKLLALFLRPYQKGRDFYDLIWFLAQKNIEPNYKILQEKGFKIKNKKELIKKMEEVISELDLKQASKDVERFLFYPEQAKWILDFNKHLKSFEK